MKNVERWRPVVGFEGSYEVSDCGRVKSIPRTTTKGGLMNLHINGRNGYVYVPLYKNGRMHNKRVHILVMEAFTDYRSNGFDPSRVIDHIDGCKTNNHLSNLEVVTQAENDRRARLKKTQRYNGVEIIDLDSNQIYKNYTDAARSAGGSLGEMVARVCRGDIIEADILLNIRITSMAQFQNIKADIQEELANRYGDKFKTERC